MAAANNAGIVGDFEVRIGGWDTLATEDTPIFNAKRYDRSILQCGLADLLRKPASYMVISLYKIGDVASGSNADTLPFIVPFPLELFGIVLGAEAGATITLDVLAKPSGGAFASILDATEVVVAGTPELNVPEENVVNADHDYVFHRLDYLTQVKMNVAAAGGSSAVGAQAHLLCQRL